MPNSKIFLPMNIYQVFTRLFGANVEHPVPHGSKSQNGCGTMSSFTQKALAEIKAMGFTHIWYTGIIEHATQTDYSRYGIRKDKPEVVIRVFLPKMTTVFY